MNTIAVENQMPVLLQNINAIFKTPAIDTYYAPPAEVPQLSKAAQQWTDQTVKTFKNRWSLVKCIAVYLHKEFANDGTVQYCLDELLLHTETGATIALAGEDDQDFSQSPDFLRFKLNDDEDQSSVSAYIAYLNYHLGATVSDINILQQQFNELRYWALLKHRLTNSDRLQWFL